MKENRKLLREVLKDIRHDMTDEEVLNLLADSKISVRPESGKEKYTLGQRAADTIAKFAGSWAERTSCCKFGSRCWAAAICCRTVLSLSRAAVRWRRSMCSAVTSIKDMP